jgi:hypothetical protein
MDILTSSLFARGLRFACPCALLPSHNSALYLTLAFLGYLDGDGVAITIIAFSIVIVLFLIIYISELANVAVFEGEHQ